MKWILSLGSLIGIFIMSAAFADLPMTLSAPIPAIASHYKAGENTVITYTITNNIPNRSFQISVNGISGPVSRALVANDCGSNLPLGPSTCNLGILIAPNINHVGQTFNQQLEIDYQGRSALNSNIVFSVDPLPAKIEYAYVADFSGHVYQCTLNSDYSLNICTATPASGAPNWAVAEISFQTFNGTEYAYVADYNGNIYQCSLNAGGTFKTCKQTLTTGTPNWAPAAFKFHMVNGVQYCYVADYKGNMYQCSLNTDGTFNTCTITPASGAPSWTPADVDFATIDGVQYSYISDANNGNVGHVYQCSLNIDGSFNTCTPTPASNAPAWVPDGFSFVTINGVRYAYITDFQGYMYRCSLNSDGSFNTCSSTPLNGVMGWAPDGVATFARSNGTLYSYVPDANGKLYQCIVYADGTFNGCTPTPANTPLPWVPDGITFAAF